VSAEDLVWAYGCCGSRSYGSEAEGPVFAPYIDLINHHSSAGTPHEFSGETEQGQFIHLVFIASEFDDQPRPLLAGDEVFVSYTHSVKATGQAADPTSLFLQFGFVPDDLLAPTCPASSKQEVSSVAGVQAI